MQGSRPRAMVEGVTELSPTRPLRNGSHIPLLGLGLYKMSNDEAPDAVVSALEIGYRHFDTATLYGNEAGVGERELRGLGAHHMIRRIGAGLDERDHADPGNIGA